MHENHVNEKETAVENTEHIAEDYTYKCPAIQMALFILRRVHNKQYQIGIRMFYDELEEATKASKTTYKETLTFLESTGMVVNEVVVESRVPQSLIQRCRILGDE